MDARPGVGLETGAAHVRVATTEGHEVHVLPNAIARTRPGARRQVLVGDLIESECLDYGGLQLRLPIDRGLVVDWQAQKAVWDRALVRALGCSSDTFGALRGHTVIVTEPYFLLPEQQRAFDMLLFEWYEADAIWRTTRTYKSIMRSRSARAIRHGPVPRRHGRRRRGPQLHPCRPGGARRRTVERCTEERALHSP